MPEQGPQRPQRPISEAARAYQAEFEKRQRRQSEEAAAKRAQAQAVPMVLNKNFFKGVENLHLQKCFKDTFEFYLQYVRSKKSEELDDSTKQRLMFVFCVGGLLEKLDKALSGTQGDMVGKRESPAELVRQINKVINIEHEREVTDIKREREVIAIERSDIERGKQQDLGSSSLETQSFASRVATKFKRFMRSDHALAEKESALAEKETFSSRVATFQKMFEKACEKLELGSDRPTPTAPKGP